MPSFWPFKGDSTSAASFEKTLSQLSTKINKASAQNERLRHNKRHGKALLTLYTSFAYIIIALILTLVTGWDSWGPVEYSAVAGGPVLIYGGRTALDAYYNYRIAKSQRYLNGLNDQREATIEKLKTATKYNSTQQLLDKYGGGSPQQGRGSPQPGKKRKSEGPQSKQGTPQPRTGFAPPPTANIPGRGGPQVPLNTEESSGGGIKPQVPMQPGPGVNALEPSEEFAPNAFSTAPSGPPMPRLAPSTQYDVDGPKWYDRIMDVVLGEDETSAKNRIALICQNCRLVNGQAPPGARTLEDIGRWRCSSCHAWNGRESEEKKILSQIASATDSSASPTTAPADAPTAVADEEEDNDGFEHVDEEVEGEGSDAADDGARSGTPSGSTRSKVRHRKKA